MRAEAPAGGQNRPPAESAAGQAGASLRPTVRIRPTVKVAIDPDRVGRFHPSDPYVRRFWVAAIGAGAVAELLRLVRAAERGEDVRLPRSLPILLKHGLVFVREDTLLVGACFPEVPVELRWRFPPTLAAEHSRWLSSNRPG